jgi:hypothetical protein
MEKIVSKDDNSGLFNSPFESAIRALILLDAYYPKTLSLSALVLLDHLIVHTADVDGPESLHVDIPHRSGELLVRRTVIEDGIKYMRKLNLICLSVEDTGLYYLATEDAQPFVTLLRTPYNEKLKKRAQWLAKNIQKVDDQSIEKMLIDKINRWQTEFFPQQ